MMILYQRVLVSNARGYVPTCSREGLGFLVRYSTGTGTGTHYIGRLPLKVRAAE